MNTETLFKALDDAQFLEDGLRQAYKAAIQEGLECAALLLLDQIEAAAKMRVRIEQIRSAVEMELAGE